MCGISSLSLDPRAVVLISAATVGLLSCSTFGQVEGPNRWSYSTLMKNVQSDNVSELDVRPDRDAVATDKASHRWLVVLPADTSGLDEQLALHHVTVRYS